MDEEAKTWEAWLRAEIERGFETAVVDDPRRVNQHGEIYFVYANYVNVDQLPTFDGVSAGALDSGVTAEAAARSTLAYFQHHRPPAHHHLYWRTVPQITYSPKGVTIPARWRGRFRAVTSALAPVRVSQMENA